MSHAANHYVKLLTVAPNGERITASEKVVLGLLADDHNEQVGLAWPKIATLAKLAGKSPRNCSKTLAQLERKGIIRRHPTVRVNDNGQSSNEYSFCELPLADEQIKRLDDNLKKLQRVQRLRLPFTPPSLTTSPPRRKRHPLPVGSDTTPPSQTTGSPRQDRRPKNPEETRDLTLFADSEDEPKGNPPTPQKRGVSEPAEGHVLEEQKLDVTQQELDRWNQMRIELKGELSSIPANVAAKFATLKPGENDYDACFRNWWLLGVKRDAGLVVLETQADDLGATAAGVEKYKARLDRLVRKHYRVPKDQTLTFSVSG